MANIKSHGLDFADLENGFDWNDALTSPTYAGRRGERRYKSIGLFKDKLIVVIFAPLGTEGLSIISMRPAGASERRRYDQNESED